MIKFSKTQLDTLSTFVGLTIAVIGALNAYDYLPKRESGCAAAILTAVFGYLSNKPAAAHPTTEEAEDKAIKD